MAKEVASHLIELGHRDIAMVFPPLEGNDRARGRFEGAVEELRLHYPDQRPPRITEARYSISDGKEAVADILTAPHRPSAFLCGNDVRAVGALYAARRLGLPVPEDLSIIGIGDFKGSKEMEPGLTIIRIPARSIGKISGDQLARQIINNARDVLRTNCEITLTQRQTCAPLTT